LNDFLLKKIPFSQPVLWTREALSALFQTQNPLLPAFFYGISIDTRTLSPGDLFFALSGLHRDGHEFVEKAFASGAGAAVVARAHAASCALHGPVFVVDDTLVALQNLGRASRLRSRAKIAAITGSVGKTSTKEMLRLALNACCPGGVHASQDSYNNHWGVPLSLGRMPAESTFGIFELGMSAPGEIAALTALVRPHVALLTRIAPAHLAFFPSIEAIADAKGEIFQGVEEGGAAVLNRDDPYYERLKNHALENSVGRILTYGIARSADLCVEEMHATSYEVRVHARLFGESVCYSIPHVGKTVAFNSLAVVLAAYALGADVQTAGRGLSAYQPPGGRGCVSQRKLPQGGGFFLIDESYNANPVSMAAAFEALASRAGTQGRRIAVLADMLELGTKSEILHRNLVESLVNCGIDYVFAAGPSMEALWEALPKEKRGFYGATVEALEEPLCEALLPGDWVVVKGSNSTGISKVVRALTKRFPPVFHPFSESASQ
jgi:UDP-N-acetylmuramoyl-tripeptide--D-alanyl-D-alanine ligase